jgi:phosphatidylserine/phosphatidylglycerophosphate/cardiolipin synthase-like enzyme
MAKFLDGPSVQASLTDLIKNTEKELFIISPYLKISTMMKNYLTSIDSKKIPVSIIYRSETKINEDDIAFFNTLNYLKLYQCENLHSKCYINEKDGLITSMNLHEHSQTHNWEMGIPVLH